LRARGRARRPGGERLPRPRRRLPGPPALHGHGGDGGHGRAPRPAHRVEQRGLHVHVRSLSPMATAARALGWPALTGVSLVVSLTALVSATRPASESARPFRLRAHLPGPVTLLAAGAATLAAITAIAIG